MVQYLGFVSGDQKNQLLREADLFCFPTYYENENQPVNLIEAMAFGLPILTTRWRSLPELFPANYPGLVNVRSPEQIAERSAGVDDDRERGRVSGYLPPQLYPGTASVRPGGGVCAA